MASSALEEVDSGYERPASELAASMLNTRTSFGATNTFGASRPINGGSTYAQRYATTTPAKPYGGSATVNTYASPRASMAYSSSRTGATGAGGAATSGASGTAKTIGSAGMGVGIGGGGGGGGDDDGWGAAAGGAEAAASRFLPPRFFFFLPPAIMSGRPRAAPCSGASSVKPGRRGGRRSTLRPRGSGCWWLRQRVLAARRPCAG